MILSDGEIKEAFEDGSIVFIPPLDEEYLAIALTTSALDLRLGDEIQYYKPLNEVVPIGLTSDIFIDAAQPGVIPDLIQKWGTVESIAGGHYDLQPGKFVLGSTREVIQLPETGCIAARVEGKSTLARLGFVVHMTAPTIHSGFRGTITLEMQNFGEYPVRLTPGARVCQLIFERLGKAPTNSQATQYQDQTKPSGE